MTNTLVLLLIPKNNLFPCDLLLSKKLKEAKPNSIILLHDIYPTSVDAALKIVDALQKEGYWFVTVEELMME